MTISYGFEQFYVLIVFKWKNGRIKKIQLKLSFSCCVHSTQRCSFIDFRITLVVSSHSNEFLMREKIVLLWHFHLLFSLLLWSNCMKHIKLINGFLCHMRNFVTNQFLRWSILEWFKGYGVPFRDSNSVFDIYKDILCFTVLISFNKSCSIKLKWTNQYLNYGLNVEELVSKHQKLQQE